MAEPGTPRLNRPDAAILQRALEPAAARAGAEAQEAEWVVGDRMDRPQSTLFPLRLVSGGHTHLHAFYKVFRVEEGLPGPAAASKLATFRRVLERGPELTRQYSRLASGVPVALPEILAADVEMLTEVQVALAGRPLGHVLPHAVPGRRSRAIRLYRSLGEAVAVIESCKDAGLNDDKRLHLDVAAGVQGLSDVIGDRDRSRLLGLLHDLHREVIDEYEPSYCHGDITGDNVLVTATGAGLIDPLWSSRWRAHDIALHTARLRYELPSMPSWTRRLVDEMLSGYGDAALLSSPSCLLTRLWYETSIAGRQSHRLVGKVRRRIVVQNLLSTLGPRPH